MVETRHYGVPRRAPLKGCDIAYGQNRTSLTIGRICLAAFGFLLGALIFIAWAMLWLDAGGGF